MNDQLRAQTLMDACLLLADGSVFFGVSIGAKKTCAGELCFNTGMTGYQETLTDPSYTGQIITFTFPHIGNIGCNVEDVESAIATASGLVVREIPTLPSNYRAANSLQAWLETRNISGIAGIDTRALTRHIRTKGAMNAVIFTVAKDAWAQASAEAKKILDALPDMKGMEIAAKVTTEKSYKWKDSLHELAKRGERAKDAPIFHVVAVDYGAKLNILRHLTAAGGRVTVVPAQTSAEDILSLKPDGIFLSNGPGDPAATGKYALPVIEKLMATGKPIFGICLGHQLLGLALGGKTEKMVQGHRGMNHPIKDLQTGEVLITSQNHGFVVSDKDLPAHVEVTHRSLFDGTVQGIRHTEKPIFGVQGHPEASPGPHESGALFDRFVALMEKVR